METKERRRLDVVSHVQRSTRMTAGQQRAWAEIWPQIGRRLEEIPAGPVDFSEWFGRTAPVVLEIGSGMGEPTAQLAATAPEVDHLAAEVYQAGHGQLMLWAERGGVSNLRLLLGDAVIFLMDHVPAGSLHGVRIYFPDPWPKKRHHKRRLIQPAFVALIASRLAPGGTLHLATDWAHYADQMLEVCTAEPLLTNQYDTWAPRPDWRPVTKFESRAHREGRPTRDLLFTRH
ncbi:tRNA (guanosine(46)-N7)-methyltransferase TrmB [Kribbella sp. NBC_01245]|uniref:tRNA (guanosine(46)-N7)-methyltransferase TrmB n=1 Tax=Kribbella sp. NBC_01245 TaxID=2903578 RepID=UPI002E288A74|nr:tRNA (guanosine(46)-N7)-methyltransferase TrmB [Kribbella sp. NBC_01245]